MISDDSVVLISFDKLELSFDLLLFEQEAIKKIITKDELFSDPAGSDTFIDLTS